MQKDFKNEAIGIKNGVVEDNSYLFTIEGVENSRNKWFHLKVPEENYKACKEALNSKPSGSINLEDYGDVVDSGWGEPPSINNDLSLQAQDL